MPLTHVSWGLLPAKLTTLYTSSLNPPAHFEIQLNSSLEQSLQKNLCTRIKYKPCLSLLLLTDFSDIFNPIIIFILILNLFGFFWQEGKRIDSVAYLLCSQCMPGCMFIVLSSFTFTLFMSYSFYIGSAL